MNLKEFREKIERARHRVSRGNPVCYAFEDPYPFGDISRLFSDLFSPRLEGFNGHFIFWLGDFNKKGTERRLFYLDMFEAYCISFKVYKEF